MNKLKLIIIVIFLIAGSFYIIKKEKPREFITSLNKNEHFFIRTDKRRYKIGEDVKIYVKSLRTKEWSGYGMIERFDKKYNQWSHFLGINACGIGLGRCLLHIDFIVIQPKETKELAWMTKKTEARPFFPAQEKPPHGRYRVKILVSGYNNSYSNEFLLE